MKALGRQEAEEEYHKLKDTQEKENKKLRQAMKEQYENMIEKRESELKKFVQEFKDYHAKKKEEVHEA